MPYRHGHQEVIQTNQTTQFTVLNKKSATSVSQKMAKACGVVDHVKFSFTIYSLIDHRTKFGWCLSYRVRACMVPRNFWHAGARRVGPGTLTR